MAELSPNLIRRVLLAFANGDTYEGLMGTRVGDDFILHAMCSDFFGWAIADAEPIETERDVALIEECRADLARCDDDQTIWIGELYAARRRNIPPAPMMTDGGKYSLSLSVAALFLALPVVPVDTGDGEQ